MADIQDLSYLYADIYALEQLHVIGRVHHQARRLLFSFRLTLNNPKRSSILLIKSICPWSSRIGDDLSICSPESSVKKISE